MAGFFAELFVYLFDGVVPKRANDFMASTMAFIVGCMFTALAAFITLQIVKQQATSSAGIGVLLFAALAVLSFTLMVKWHRASRDG